MIRSTYVRNMTAAMSAVLLVGLLPATVVAQGGRDNGRQNPRAGQRGDRERSPRQRQDQDSARNRERGNQNQNNSGWRNDNRDYDRDQRWRQDQDRNRMGRRDDDRNRRDSDWNRNDDRNRNRDNRRDSDWNRDWERDNRRDGGWDSRDDNRWQRNDEAGNRQKTKNEWRNLAIAAGGVAAYGILRKDPTIAFAGAVGALYSLNRYEQDRRSQNSIDRARASLFSQPYIYRDGDRYERCLVERNGQRYYRFERCP